MKKCNGQSFKSTCSYCGVGCGVVVEKNGEGGIYVKGDTSHTVNRGMLCSKGMNLHYTVMDQSDRLLYPQLRAERDQPRKRVSWGHALDEASSIFKRLIKQEGPDSVGFYVSGQCLTEEYYIVNKLAKGFIGTNNIDTNSRLCMSSAVSAYKQALGEDAVPLSYDDIELGSCFFIAGANPAWCHPILFRRLEAHKEKNPEVKVLVADPRKTQSCSIADLHLQLKPGTDVVLFHAIARVLIERGNIDISFIKEHTNGFEAFRSCVMGRSLKEAAHICELNVEEIQQAAEWIGHAERFISMWAMGLNQSVNGVDKILALINVSLITGQIGKPGAGPFSLTGQANAMGGREVGGMATLLPAHRNLDDPRHREEVADFWGVSSIPSAPGFTATEMFEALRSGKMKAIWIMCTNPVVSLPHSTLVEEALESADFVVVQDISKDSETTDYADLLLPAAGYLEKEGTMTNSERRISYLNKVVDAPGQALPDAEIIRRFARHMKYEGFEYKSSAAIFDEYSKLTQGTNVDISGLSHHWLKENGSVQWPFPKGSEAGTPRLFTDHKFYTPDGRAKINTPKAALPLRKHEELPLILTTGRVRDQWHTRTRTGKVARLNQHTDKAYVQMHPEDAASRNINHNDVVKVFNERGQVRLEVALSEDIKPGVIFIPIHWGKMLKDDFSRANNLTSTRIDPVSGQPDFKYATVEVARVEKKKEKIVVVGAGAAGFQFVNHYRELNTKDEVEVFSKERDWFYNRVLLPHYVSGDLEWNKLQKMKKDTLEKLDITLHEGVSVESIDPDAKTLVDSKDLVHSYDRLILATGSRPNFPQNIPRLAGIFTIRRRSDAERLKSYMDESGHVVIVGGGLLGLEMAASLQQTGVDITIVQRGSQLMGRQLDPTASKLLYKSIRGYGIDIILNDEVEHLSWQGKKNWVGLKSGQYLACKAIVFAIGTKPNMALAQEADLACERGVVVNEHLQTSRADIFAIGEIAEFEDEIYGITAAAEQQAEVAAEYILGNSSTFYSGTVLMNILKFPNLELCSMGITQVPDGKEGYEEVVLLDEAQHFYKKCVVYQDKLVGAILMGDKAEFNEFRKLIESEMELSDRRKALLRSASSLPPVKGKLVCSCNNVGAGNISEAIEEEEAYDFNELCQHTGAGTGCGSCKPEIKAILEESKATVP